MYRYFTNDDDEFVLPYIIKPSDKLYNGMIVTDVIKLIPENEYVLLVLTVEEYRDKKLSDLGL